MAKIIIADENEGRRTLLANSLERQGFDVTRAGTLRQAEGTALAVMPEVVVIDGEWRTGDAIDSSQRLMGDPEFAFKCRIVILSRNTSQEYLISAAKAGVHEVMSKPIDMNQLIDQLNKHAKKQFVPPPADVASSGGGGGSFDVGAIMGGGSWALPMLKGLIGPDKINEDFINEILGQMGEEGMEVEADLNPVMLSTMLQKALSQIVQDADEEGALEQPQEGQEESIEPTAEEESADDKSSVPSFQQLSKGKTLGGGGSASNQMKRGFGGTMEDILEGQAQKIADEVEEAMSEILDEVPDKIAIHEDETMMLIDPEVVKMTKLVNELAHELMWSLGRPGAVSDLTLMTQIEDMTEMLGDVVAALPDLEEEE